MLRQLAAIFLTAVLGLLAACSQASPSPVSITLEAPTPADIRPTPSQAAPTSTSQPSPTLPATPTDTAIPPARICSPLEDIGLEELDQPDLMKNPFEAPRPGMDDGHPGVDFAYWSRGERTEMIGLGIYSMLEGRVAGVIQNRSPYGYALFIETPLEGLPPALIQRLLLPTPAPTVEPAPNLLCPAGDASAQAHAGRSLYLLYAHLNLPPDAAIDQWVDCGQSIGQVGTTGRSVNPHLHLETRVGPAGATFTDLAHYDNSVSEAEMRNYCTWRVSGLFQPLDPLAVIQAFSLQP